jgi:hypothetical protein
MKVAAKVTPLKTYQQAQLEKVLALPFEEKLKRFRIIVGPERADTVEEALETLFNDVFAQAWEAAFWATKGRRR